MCEKCYKYYDSGQKKKHDGLCSRRIRRHHRYVEGRREQCQFCHEVFVYGMHKRHEQRYCKNILLIQKRIEREERRRNRLRPVYVSLSEVGGAPDFEVAPGVSTEFRSLLHLSNVYAVVLHSSPLFSSEVNGSGYNKQKLLLVDDETSPIVFHNPSTPSFEPHRRICKCCFFYKNVNRLPATVKPGDIIRLHRVQRPCQSEDSDCLVIFAGQSSAWVLFSKDDRGYEPKAQSDNSYTWLEEDKVLLNHYRKFANDFIQNLFQIAGFRRYSKRMNTKKTPKTAGLCSKILPSDETGAWFDWIFKLLPRKLKNVCERCEDDETFAGADA